MNNKTHSVKQSEIIKKWFVVDAEGIPLGRLASNIATILKGKHKPTYTTHLDCGDYVIVVNSDKMVLTGNKLNDKVHRHHTGFIGSLKEVSYKTIMEKNSDRALIYAVKGMLPKNSLGREMINKLKIFKGPTHNMEAQQPEVLNLGGNNND
ncbi:MAG: 50S ribosomal protein L13 [Clostridia bacterium]